jgi:hypothetical protein
MPTITAIGINMPENINKITDVMYDGYVNQLVYESLQSGTRINLKAT